jgi:hypothetical protein
LNKLALLWEEQTYAQKKFTKKFLGFQPIMSFEKFSRQKSIESLISSRESFNLHERNFRRT